MKFIYILFILLSYLIKLYNSALKLLNLYPDPKLSSLVAPIPDRNQFLYGLTMVENNSFVVHVRI